jgi:hypothetical protein
MIPSFSGGLVQGNSPPEQEEMAAAETAPEGQEKPMQSFFQAVSNAHASKLGGLAMRAAR